MGDDSKSSNATPSASTQVRTPKCRTPDQWFDLEYVYDDLYSTPIANMPFEVTCKRDPGIKQRGTTDAEGKAHVEGLIPGPLAVEFNPDSDAAERQEAAQLRKEMKQTLDSIIANIQQDAVYKQQAWDDTSDIMKGVIYAGAAAQGAWDGATEFVEFIAQAGAFLAKAGMAYADVWGCIVTGDIKTLERKLEQGRAKGEELADDAIETFENLFLLLSDEEVRDMLYDFPERYWDAHHSVDQVYMAGSAGSDLVVGVVLGALTGGAGAAAMAGKAVAKGGQAVTKVMELIAQLVPKLKKIKAKLGFNGSTKAKRKYKLRRTRPNQPVNTKHSANSNQPGTNPNGDACPIASKTCVDGEPISLVTGEELLEQEDFTLPGLIPFTWKRLYRTSNPRNRGLGHGWSFPTCETLQIGNDAILYNDAEGRQIELPVPEIGQFTSNSAEGLFLHRDWHTVFYLKQPGQPDKLFIGPNATSATLKLAALIDTTGNRWDCFYNQQTQQIQRMESSWGSVLEFQNNDKGLIQSIRERTGEGHNTLARYHYSAEHDLIAIEDAGGDSERFAYQNHIITQRTLRTGYSFYFAWDQLTPKARCLRQWGDPVRPGAEPTYDYRFEWDTQARITRSTDSNGGVREVHYNPSGQVLRETDPLGHTTHHEYDRNGRKAKTIDALGHEHNYYYDDVGNPTGQTDSAGGGFTLLYDEQHRPTCFTDAVGNSWTREYNDDGLISKTIDAEGNETQYFYNAQGLPEVIINPKGEKQILAWAPNGQLLTRAQEGVEPTQYQYDHHGHVAQVQQGSHTTRYQHNAKGDVTAIHYPDGSSAGLTYNANRQLTAYTDPLGRTTRFEYDGLAQVTKRIDPAGNSLHYHYDRERNLIGLTNENGEHYQLQYDACERLIQEIGFDGRVQQYQYNPLGHLIAHIEGQITTRFERDPMGRLLHKHTPDGSDITFGYDANGRLTSATNAQRTLAFAYTPNGQLHTEAQDQASLQHQYDPQGNRIATTLPSGVQLGYEYDPLGQFTALDYNGNRLTQLHRNQQGQEISRTQGNLQAGFDYDPAGRLTRHWVQNHGVQGQQAREAIIDRQYQYDGAGRLNIIDDLRKGKTQYHYDALDRLKAVEGYSREQFDFDPAGNILSLQNGSENTRNGQANTTKGNRLAFHGDRHFTYDARGNLTEERRGTGGKLSTKYTYNSQNQLIKVEKGGQVFEYAYDPLGRRIRKKDAFGETEFLWNGDVLLSEKRNHKDKLYLYEPNSFKPLAFIENNQCYFYHNDHLGTPQELTDWEGRVVWSARYQVYGNVIRKDVEQVENNLRAPGQYYDQESGLHYSRFRYYDPGTGSFTQQDPIGLLGGINNYQYAPNPIGWIDPLGLSCKELTSWNQFQKDTKGHFANSSEAAKSYNRMKEVDEMENGLRPGPSDYLPQSYIDAHLQKFDDGAAYITPKAALDNWGRDPVGRSDGQFVMSGSQMDGMLARTGGDMTQIEKELGIKPGSWSNQEMAVIKIPDTSKLNVRIPTGNESGANEFWLSGGKLPTGQLEAVVDPIPKGMYSELSVKDATDIAKSKK